jgi:hypothetical protein
MQLALKAPACDKDNGNGSDGSITVRNEYPKHPAISINVTKGCNLSHFDEVDNWPSM